MNTDIKSINEKNILITTCFGHFLSHYNMLAFPALILPLSNHLKLSIPQILEMSFFMYLLFGITALLWGIAADKIGSKPLFIIFFTGAGISGIIASVSGNSAVQLTVALSFIGAFSGIHHPVGLGLISKEIKRVSVAHGTHGMFGNLGLALAPLFTGFLNWVASPAAAYLFLGILNLSGLIILLKFPFSQTHDEQKEKNNTIVKKLSPFLILLFAMTLGGVVYRGATIITPVLLELNTNNLLIRISSLSPFDISPNLFASVLTSLIFIVGVFAQFAGGRLAEKYSPEYCYLIFHSTAIPFAFLICYSSDYVLFAFTALYFFFLLGMQPSENTLVTKLVPRKFLSSSFGLKFILTFGVGSGSVKATGIISDLIGVENVFSAIGCTSLILVATIIVLIYPGIKIQKGVVYESI